MPFSEVSLYNFRNIQEQKIPVFYKQVFFIGSNGQGKTNFLEALYFISYGSSFRVNRDEYLVKNGHNEMSVSAKWHSEKDDLLGVNIKITYVKGKKSIYINNSVISDRRDLLENIPAIIFSHNDISFVKGSPEKRRWFFNQCLSRYKLSFIDTLRAYKKLLKTRNHMIKEKNTELVKIYDQRLAEVGLEIGKARQNLILDFNKIFTPLFEKISEVKEVVYIEYQASWKSEDVETITKELEKRIERDMFLGTTGTGPHRDMFLFKIGNRNYLNEASTGQIRLISLILRVAQAELYTRMSTKKPVLLIDDVLLEIDSRKREKFIRSLPEYDQIFFTFLPNEKISNYMRNKFIMYSVDNGEYRKLE